MNTTEFLEEAKAEIARLQKVVDLLEGSPKRKGKGKKKGPMPQSQRDKIAAGRKAAWAKVKKPRKAATAESS